MTPRWAAVTGLAAASMVLLTAGGAAPPASLQAPAQSSTGSPQYVGISRCAAGPCHGAAEQATWQNRDRHSGAYATLQNKQSQSIARILGIGAAEQADLCLDCHTVNPPPQQRDPRFQISDGVGCEACHGPASMWLQDHYVEGQGAPSRSDLLARGLTDTEDLSTRAEICLSCHVGDERRSVTHRMIAAGHPELAFELDTFISRMPPHWKPPEEAGFGARQWAVGQAAALSMSMKLLARRMEGDAFLGWPDFADFECSSCHHPYPSAQRQVAGDEAGPGRPPLNPARLLIFGRLVEAAMPGGRAELDSEVKALHQALQQLGRDRAGVAETARRLAATADRLESRLKTLNLSNETVRAILATLHRDALRIAGSGVRSAEQLHWAADALLASLQKRSGSDSDVESLVQQIERTIRQRYPQAFASQPERPRE